MSTAGSDRPLGELFSDLANETASLVRQEVALARTEMEAKVTVAAHQAAVVCLGAALVNIAGLALAGALVTLLALWMPLWVAALGVGLVILPIGWGVTQRGMAGLQQIKLVPVQTMREIEENKRWAKRELSQ